MSAFRTADILSFRRRLIELHALPSHRHAHLQQMIDLAWEQHGVSEADRIALVWRRDPGGAGVYLVEPPMYFSEKWGVSKWWIHDDQHDIRVYVATKFDPMRQLARAAAAHDLKHEAPPGR